MDIVKEKKQILASEKDSRVFFDAVIQLVKPSKTLQYALKDYNDFISNTK